MTTAQSTLDSDAVARKPPAVREGILRASWSSFRRDPLRFLCRIAHDHGDVVEFGFAPAPVYLLRNPADVQHVLVDNNRNYNKQTRGYGAMRHFLGNGLLTSEGAFWRRQRRIAQPGFHRQRIAAFADTMVALTQRMVDGWSGQDTVDISEAMTNLTLQIVAQTLLSAEIRDDQNEIGRAVMELNEHASRLMTNPLTLPPTVPTPKNLRFRRTATNLDKIVTGIIAERRREGTDRGDLLSMLMQTRDADTGEGMSDQQLRDEAMTIFMAGHETTANALAWAFYLLSLHPDVCRRVREELATELEGRAPTMQDLPRLELLTRVVKESLRLYPPAWAIGRRAIAEDVIGGFRIRKRGLIILSPYVTHRDPKYWDNPEGFDPERFTPEGERRRPRYAYFPFGGGPRLCIGNNFAMMEAELVLATVLTRVIPSLVPGHPVVPEALITLRPKYGMPMQLRRAS